MALISSTNTTSSHDVFCEKIRCEEKNINLNECYHKIYNIFSESAYKEIPEWSKNLSTLSNNSIFSFPLFRLYDDIRFSMTHKVENFNSFINESYPKDDNKINNFILILLERFAKELNLVGHHEIQVNFFQTIHTEDSDIQHCQEIWHYRSAAKTTMVAVFQNDFSYAEEACGLDIAHNNALKPFQPLHFQNLEPSVPKDGYQSLTYPENGAIIFNQMQGQIIHKQSELAKPLLDISKRTVVEISLKDPDWNFSYKK